MKKLIYCLLSCMCLVGMQGYAEGVVEFTIEDLSPEVIEGLKKGNLDGILQIEKGETLPLMIAVEGDVVALSDETSSCVDFEFNRKMYMKFERGNFLFSEDKASWKSFDEQFKGMLRVSYGEGTVGPIKMSSKNLKKGKFRGNAYLDEGATIPLALSIKGDLFTFSETSPTVHVEACKRIYVKMEKDNVLFSLDRDKWLSAQEQFKGMLHVALGNEDKGLLKTLVLK